MYFPAYQTITPQYYPSMPQQDHGALYVNTPIRQHNRLETYTQELTDENRSLWREVTRLQALIIASNQPTYFPIYNHHEPVPHQEQKKKTASREEFSSTDKEINTPPIHNEHKRFTKNNYSNKSPNITTDTKISNDTISAVLQRQVVLKEDWRKIPASPHIHLTPNTHSNTITNIQQSPNKSHISSKYSNNRFAILMDDKNEDSSSSSLTIIPSIKVIKKDKPESQLIIPNSSTNVVQNQNYTTNSTEGKNEKDTHTTPKQHNTLKTSIKTFILREGYYKEIKNEQQSLKRPPHIPPTKIEYPTQQRNIYTYTPTIHVSKEHKTNLSQYNKKKINIKCNKPLDLIADSTNDTRVQLTPSITSPPLLSEEGKSSNCKSETNTQEYSILTPLTTPKIKYTYLYSAEAEEVDTRNNSIEVMLHCRHLINMNLIPQIVDMESDLQPKAKPPRSTKKHINSDGIKQQNTSQVPQTKTSVTLAKIIQDADIRSEQLKKYIVKPTFYTSISALV